MSEELVQQVLPPDPEKTVYKVAYVMTYLSESGASMKIHGMLEREAMSPETALKEVHTFLSRAAYAIPMISNGNVRLMTPEYPDTFIGRTFVQVEVGIGE